MKWHHYYYSVLVMRQAWDVKVWLAESFHSVWNNQERVVWESPADLHLAKSVGWGKGKDETYWVRGWGQRLKETILEPQSGLSRMRKRYPQQLVPLALYCKQAWGGEVKWRERAVNLLVVWDLRWGK
jgi:hypothetical protein